MKVKRFSVEAIREEFPILARRVYDKPLVYLDNAATTQKPDCVLRALLGYYRHSNANIHRGVHALAQEATTSYEETRSCVQQFIHAAHAHEVIFTKGATESLNLVAQSFGRMHLKAKDRIVVSPMEHHSSLVPWQLACEATGATLDVLPLDETGAIPFAAYAQALKGAALVVLVHASNSLGTINPIQRMIALAHQHAIPVVVDGAQAIAHLAVNVQQLDADFYAFSSHKLYGPMGVGVLYGKEKWLEAMPPYQSGGEMIESVSYKKTSFNSLPHKFEAGTPNVGDVIAFGEAIRFVLSIGLKTIAEHEQKLLKTLTQLLPQAVPTIQMIGTAKEKVSIVSFIVPELHPLDIGQFLDAHGIALRTGHHCTQPLMDQLGIQGTLRASMAIYNTEQEMEMLATQLAKIVHLLKK